LEKSCHVPEHRFGIKKKGKLTSYPGKATGREGEKME